MPLCTAVVRQNRRNHSYRFVDPAAKDPVSGDNNGKKLVMNEFYTRSLPYDYAGKNFAF